MTVTQKWVFTHVPGKEFFVHAEKKERSNRPAAGGHSIQHLNTLVPVRLNGNVSLVQYLPEQFDPFLPRELPSQRIQLLQTGQSGSDQRANPGEIGRFGKFRRRSSKQVRHVNMRFHEREKCVCQCPDRSFRGESQAIVNQLRHELPQVCQLRGPARPDYCLIIFITLRFCIAKN